MHSMKRAVIEMAQKYLLSVTETVAPIGVHPNGELLKILEVIVDASR